MLFIAYVSLIFIFKKNLFNIATVKQLLKRFEGKGGAAEEKGSYEELTVADVILYLT